MVVNRNTQDLSNGRKMMLNGNKSRVGGSITFEKPKLNDVTYNAVKPLNGVLGVGKTSEPYKPAITPPPVVTNVNGGSIANSIKDINFAHMLKPKKKPKNIKLTL